MQNVHSGCSDRHLGDFFFGVIVMKTCSICGKAKPADEFYPTRPQCKECKKERSRRWAKENVEKKRSSRRRWREENVEKARAHGREEYRRKRQRGTVPPGDPAKKKAQSMASSLPRPSHCSKCGTEGPVDGHHEDYSRPLDVIWLCRRCHSRQHHQERGYATKAQTRG